MILHENVQYRLTNATQTSISLNEVNIPVSLALLFMFKTSVYFSNSTDLPGKMKLVMLQRH